MVRLLAAWLCSAVVCLAAGRAAVPRVDPSGIRGKLVICGGGVLPDEVFQRFVALAGGEQARLVIIPTAGADSALMDHEKLREPWLKFAPASLDVLHTRLPEEADSDRFVAPLQRATGVWFGGGQQSRIAKAYLGTAVERSVRDLLDRGGVVGGTSAGAAIQSRRMILGGNPVPEMGVGFDLLPDAVVDQHFSQRRRLSRLLDSIGAGPPAFGLGIDESTAVIVQGREVEVVGAGSVTICLPASATRSVSHEVLRRGARADLTAWRRAALVRRRGDWPPADPLSPSGVSGVPRGALLIGGGGRLPSSVLERFVELAGGPEALIAILPTASEALVPNGAAERRMFERAGAKNLVVLPGRTPAEVESDQFLSTLARAGGVWFGGGRQWRFIDAYAGTRAVEAFHAVLRRGGIIGGSSAGASIQADYMVRGSPLGNTVMMAEGYEQGFGFLPGTAIDQHFTQRNRRPDLAQLITSWPQFLGIGIDESTALLVRGSVAEVVGDHSAWFLDCSPGNGGLRTQEVKAGDRFDLQRRQPTVPPGK